MSRTDCAKESIKLLADGWNITNFKDYANKFADKNNFETKVLNDCDPKLYYFKQKVAVTKKYSCKKGSCEEDADGPYTTQDCNKECGSSPKPTPKPQVCTYPSTFFSQKEGNEFRKFMHVNFKSYATSINLDLTGPKDNCNYIRKAFATVPDEYALSYGELFKNSKTNLNWKTDLKKENYDSYKKKQEEEGKFTSQSSMWNSLIVNERVPKGGEIKKLSGGGAWYIIKAKPDGIVVQMSGNETTPISNLITPIKSGEFKFIAWIPPVNINKEPITGKVADLNVKQNVNGEDYVVGVERFGTTWKAFDKGITFFDDIKESIITNILSLISEQETKPSVNINSYMSGPTTTDGKSGNISGMMTSTDTKPQQVTGSKPQETKVDVACISDYSKIDPDQKKSIDNFISINPSYSLTFSGTGMYSPIKLKDLRWPRKFGVRTTEENTEGNLVVPQPPDYPNYTGLCDNLLIYKKSDIQAKGADQIDSLEKFFQDEKLNMTIDESSFGTSELRFEVGALVPNYELQEKGLESFSNMPVYITNIDQVANPFTGDCRNAIKKLDACINRTKGGGLAACSNLKEIVNNKLTAWFCLRKVRGEGKFWTRIGLGREIANITSDRSDKFGISKMTAIKESRLEQTIKNTLLESIRRKNEDSLSKTIKNHLRKRLM
jgi:hypothetical protein